MNMILKTDSVKTIAISLFAGFALIGCGSASTQGGDSSERTSYEVEGDHAVGSIDAPVTIVEYASVTCGHCANWHEVVWPKIQSDYIDTGKVRFVYREFPTSPVNLATAGFLIANCADESKFFANIALQYKRQDALMAGARSGRAAQDYQALAKAAGLNEAEYEACLANEEENARLQKVVKGGFDAGVTGTPAFFINGELKNKIFKIEDFDKALSEFVDVPKRDAETEAAASADHE